MDKLFESIDYLSPQSQQVVKGLVRQLCENEGVNTPPEMAPGLQTLEEGIPLWTSWMITHYRPSTIKLYTHYVRSLIKDSQRPTTLSIQQHQAAELLEGVGAAAVKNELKAIASFFSYLYEQGLWFENPTKTMKPPKVPKRRVKSPSQEEVAKLLSVVDTPKLAVMLALFIDTGIRFRELTGLIWGGVNLKDREVTVIGKGDKERTVSLSPLVCAILEKTKNNHGQPGDLVFPSQSITGWNNTDANRSLARLCRKAGIKKYTCHQLRHFFATNTIEHGGESVIAAVSEMLGHANISTTVDFYWDTDEKRNKKVHAEHSPFSQQLLLPVLGEGTNAEN